MSLDRQLPTTSRRSLLAVRLAKVNTHLSFTRVDSLGIDLDKAFAAARNKYRVRDANRWTRK